VRGNTSKYPVELVDADFGSRIDDANPPRASCLVISRCASAARLAKRRASSDRLREFVVG
jgi:hypothetical protein